jgi:hypothetical protein
LRVARTFDATAGYSEASLLFQRLRDFETFCSAVIEWRKISGDQSRDDSTERFLSGVGDNDCLGSAPHNCG